MKFRRSLLACFFILACVASERLPGKHRKDLKKADEEIRGKIVGGQTVDITSVPYMVSVSKAPNEHFCGGSIIHSSFVLTAAHCTYGLSASSIFVRSGSTLVNKGGQVTGVKRIINNPMYNPGTVDNDVALLEMKTPITVGAIIRIADIEPLPGLWALVTGWGVNKETAKTPTPTAQAIWLPTLERSTCASAYANLNKVTTKMICAGFKQGGRDACQGDSGGPMVVGDHQAGVVSWGKGCARAGSPGIFTNLAHPTINNWIRKYIGFN